MDPIARRKILTNLIEGRLTLTEAEGQLDALQRSQQVPPIRVISNWREVWERANWQNKLLWGIAAIFLLPLGLVILMVPAVLVMALIVGLLALGMAIPALLVMLIWNGLAGMIPIPSIEFWQALLLVFLLTLLTRLMRR